MNTTRRSPLFTLSVVAAGVLLSTSSARAQSSPSPSPAAPASSSSPPPALEPTAATYPDEGTVTTPTSSSAAPLPDARSQAATTATVTLRSGAAVANDGTLTLSIGPVAITPRAYVETYY